MGHKRGSVLIVALWSILLLSSFAVILGYHARQKILFAKRVESRAAALSVAEACVKQAAIEVRKTTSDAYVYLRDPSAKGVVQITFRGVRVQDGEADLVLDISDPFAGMPTQYGLIDEERKINLNTADMEMLSKLCRAVFGYDEVQAQELAASIIDWRDADSTFSLPVGSGEDAYYRSLAHPYEAKDAPFEILPELLLVKGVDKDLLKKLSPYVTVHGSGRININTAPRQVFLALGISDHLVDKIITCRSGKDRIPGTDDDVVFLNTSEIASKVGMISPNSPADELALTATAEQYFVTNSFHFLVQCVAKIYTGKGRTELVSVIDRRGSILYWQES